MTVKVTKKRMNEYRLPFRLIVGGPEKGRLVFKSRGREI